MKNKITIFETLKREVEGNLEEVEEQYKNCDVVLTADDFVKVEFSENDYTEQENNILNEITNFCENHCGLCQECPEEECVLFRIEKLIAK